MANGKKGQKGTRRVQPRARAAPQPPKVVNKLNRMRDPGDMDSAKLAGNVMRQLVDPCNSPAVPLPDGTHGVSQMITTTSTTSLSIDANGDRHLIINPCATDKVSLSGIATYGTFTHIDDAQQTDLDADYKFLRPVGVCAKLVKTSAFDTPDGSLMYACAPEGSTISAYANAAASLAFIEENGAQGSNAGAGFEVSWCPRSMNDLDPFLPTTSMNSGSSVDLNGRLMKWRPAIHLLIEGAIGSSYRIVVTTRYEGFLKSAKQYRGTDNFTQSSRVMDAVFSQMRAIKWTAVGEAVSDVSKYAASIAGVFAGKGAAVAVGAAGNALGALLSRVGR